MLLHDAGLSFLHMNRMIHGNLRPSNVLLSAAGHAKISDVGLDEHYVPDEHNSNWYKLPEEPKSIRSDIFSAGMIFSEMLTGAIPVRVKGHLVQNEMFRSLPKEIRGVIARMLTPDPADRPASVEEILPVIDELLQRPRAPESESTSGRLQQLVASGFGLSRLSGAVGALVKGAFR